jgi:hypothetical protein
MQMNKLRSPGKKKSVGLPSSERVGYQISRFMSPFQGLKIPIESFPRTAAWAFKSRPFRATVSKTFISRDSGCIILKAFGRAILIHAANRTDIPNNRS